MMKPMGYVYSGSHAYSGPRSRVFSCWVYETGRKVYRRRVLY